MNQFKFIGLEQCHQRAIGQGLEPGAIQALETRQRQSLATIQRQLGLHRLQQVQRLQPVAESPRALKIRVVMLKKFQHAVDIGAGRTSGIEQGLTPDLVTPDLARPDPGPMTPDP
jgi:hypothetical protein